MSTKYLEQTFGLKGKVAIVTGGNTGLGRSFSDRLASAGAKIFIFAYDQTGVKEMEEYYKKNNWFLSIEYGDLTKSEDQLKLINSCLKAYGQIDILVNNAGMISRTPLLDGNDEEWTKVLNINLNAVYSLSREVAKIFKKANAGKIVNICSMLSFQGGVFVPSYTASKHAVAGLTKAFANELAEYNININAIAPGYIETANTAPIRADAKRNQAILDRIPAKRWGQPNDVADMCVFLAGKGSDYCNGYIFAVDGGWLAR